MCVDMLYQLTYKKLKTWTLSHLLPLNYLKSYICITHKSFFWYLHFEKAIQDDCYTSSYCTWHGNWCQKQAEKHERSPLHCDKEYLVFCFSTRPALPPLYTHISRNSPVAPVATGHISTLLNTEWKYCTMRYIHTACMRTSPVYKHVFSSWKKLQY